MVIKILGPGIAHPLGIGADTIIALAHNIIAQNKITYRHTCCNRQFKFFSYRVALSDQVDIQRAAHGGQLVFIAGSDIALKPNSIANQIVRLICLQVYFFLRIGIKPVLQRGNQLIQRIISLGYKSQ